MIRKVIFASIVIVLLGAIIVSALLTQEESKTTVIAANVKKVEKKNTTLTIVNPARERCTELGGTIKIQKLPYGAQYGLCYFDDGRACEEWSLFRGECEKGGVKTTGYDSMDQKYCVWRGGSTISESSSTCTFRDGKTCPTIDLYNGKCIGL